MKSLPVILFVLITMTSKAQPVYDTIPFVPEHYAKRVVQFHGEPIVKGRVVFLGNSITEFGDWKKLLNDPTVVNRGIAGDITFGVLNRLNDIISREPSKLFIKIGINDIGKGYPEALIVKNITTIVKRVKEGSPKTKVFVHSILPTNDSAKTEYPDVWGKNKTVVVINKELQARANKLDYTYIDLYSSLKDRDGALQQKYSVDGLHLNDAGYLIWIELLKKRKYL